MSTVVYGLANCDTCGKARRWLERFGVAHAFVDYRAVPPSPATLVDWAAQAGGFDALVNKSSVTWRQLPPNRKAPASAAEWKLLLREHPQLVRRPVVVTEDGRMTQGFTDNGFKQRFNPGP
ncbi:MAG TPA: Spx/MgsR family RNA polymerase-binding regulatory protein [Luteimonas sp.]|nr:Spx/MgsR family RNA polymerase-binding regulatory protein [Luteimonas sp.]